MKEKKKRRELTDKKFPTGAKEQTEDDIRTYQDTRKATYNPRKPINECCDIFHSLFCLRQTKHIFAPTFDRLRNLLI